VEGCGEMGASEGFDWIWWRGDEVEV